MIQYNVQYNIYFGTIGKTLGCRYRFTRWCRNEQEAKKVAENAANSFYYKNEGKFGIPSYGDIEKEAKITGLDIEILYKDHIKDMMRFYAIPTSEDTIPNKKLKY